jgi:hypothetical protein
VTHSVIMVCTWSVVQTEQPASWDALRLRDSVKACEPLCWCFQTCGLALADAPAAAIRRRCVLLYTLPRLNYLSFKFISLWRHHAVAGGADRTCHVSRLDVSWVRQWVV